MEFYSVVSVEEDKMVAKGKSYDGLSFKFLMESKLKKLFIFANDPLHIKIKELKSGQEVELDIAENDKGFLTLKDVGEVKESSIQPVPLAALEAKKPWNPAKFSPEERRSIERQTALGKSCELIAASGIKYKSIDDSLSDCLKVAEAFYEFISKKAEE